MNYYNENDPFCVEWLKTLIMMGEIPDGPVDNRSITEVQAKDLDGFDQCHFFAGIAGWSYALKLANWPSDRPVWTGSCPCQPFSVAGQQKGNADDRHLWPIFFELIRQCKPELVIGEQVEGAIRHGWLDGIQTDLEKESYAVGHCVLGAHSVGAPHIRQRLYWLADSMSARWSERWPVARDRSATRSSEFSRVADTDMPGEHGRTPSGEQSIRDIGSAERDGLALTQSGQFGGIAQPSEYSEQIRTPAPNASASLGRSSSLGRLGDPNNKGPQGRSKRSDEYANQLAPWVASEFIQCADGKARRAKSEIFPLAHGVPNRMGTLRGSGNAICPQTAATFISAYLDIESEI